ncbi:response regulator [Rhizobium leguminosarum]|uniref:Response regulator receiver domain family protein n=1 Tax=Rhizobium leguminosarum TaxID=384 RepID=A0A2Z4YSV6_RHILE|nr:response regulator [Rhizobium leguminosarum]AXA44149.1 Response regulator receiver domain family protein [Rhizobium leguminosarum]
MDHILVVDGDPEIRRLLTHYLVDQGFRVNAVACRQDCERWIDTSRPDLIILDVLLPDGSGLDICRNLRASRSRIAVILLTALKEEVDRIIGLEFGADDYLGKPFNPRELVARIRAVLRRVADAEDADTDVKVFNFAEFIADTSTRRVCKLRGPEIELTGAEFDLLVVFLERPGRLLSRDRLLDLTQGRKSEPMDRSIDVLMSRLRRKLGQTQSGPLFRTIRNGGYQFTVPVKAGISDGAASIAALTDNGNVRSL